MPDTMQDAIPDTIAVEDRKLLTGDGLSLFVRIYRPDLSTLPVICLPGLTRNHRDFDGIAKVLAHGGRQVICIDSRGRGGSDRDPDPSHYTVPQEMADILAVMDQLGIAKADFIGTSRGGLILHLMAAAHPDRIRRIVLNDIGPVLGVEGLRQIQTSLKLEERPQNWSDLPAYLKHVYGNAFPALTDTDWRDMTQALHRDVDGKPVVDCDPAIARQMVALDLTQPLPDLWPHYAALAQKPVLIIRGETSQLLTEEILSQMLERHPGAKTVTATGQGHAPFLHKNPVCDVITAFLDSGTTS
ncbi:alpha/beta hydrolase [Allorhizobium sp. BGMRC 0089]|uniref:alpha/beta fold hydrolase n=1 Tax=Allorhizobium sonneratiae TaxID=2934936 RepID=UPI0020332877|nr:alpha/beta hydrolase [Allorhizobium sonneratiae]MCM2291971.1 alpha/beta hydrolase [Allorhizobium sonneratiae]